MYELNISATTPEELKIRLLGLLDIFKGISFNGPLEAPITEAAPAVPAEEPKVVPIIPQAELEANTKKTPDPIPEQPTLEEVRAALKELRDRKGSGAVREVLKGYGAESLTELKPEDYLGALARAKTEV